MKVEKRFLALFFIFLILLIIYLFYKNSTENIKEVCVENKACFSVEIADSQDEMMIGLSNRVSLENSKGMLFIFQEETLTGFWMKDMKFPIDLLWIDEDKKVIGIEKNMQPCEEGLCPIFSPEKKIMYVLEINSGQSDEYGFETGNSVYF